MLSPDPARDASRGAVGTNPAFIANGGSWQITCNAAQWVREEWWNVPLNLVWADFVNYSELAEACVDHNLIDYPRKWNT